MADNLQGIGTAALQKAPQPLRRAMSNIPAQFTPHSGTVYSASRGGAASSTAIAGVAPNDPSRIQVIDQKAFAADPRYAAHEETHRWQNNLPPAIQSAIPPDNHADPYNYGGDARIAQMAKQGQSILTLPREQQAAVVENYTAQGGDNAPLPIRNTYGKVVNTINDVPLSQIEMTEPNATALNMHPRAPRPPALLMPVEKKSANVQPPDDGIDLSAGLEDHDGIDLSAGVEDPAMDAPAVKPSIPVPAGLQPQSQAPTFGSSPRDVLSTVKQHAKNMIAGPYHAIADAPKSAAEQSVVNAGGGGVFGRAGLAADRLLGVSASQQNFDQGKALWKAGNRDAAVQSLEDSVPLVGPWAKQIETDTANKGAVAGMAGLATDVFGPSVAAKAAGAALKPLARSVAVADVKNMIRPNANDAAFGKSPAEGLLNQPGGVRSMSKPGLLAKTRANIESTGQQIGDAVAQAPQTPTDVSAAVNNPFDAALQRAAKGNEKGLVTGLKDAQQGYTHDLYYDPSTGEIAGQSSPKNLNMTPSELFGLKKDVGNGIRWTNQAFDNDLNATRGQVYGGLKEKLNDAVPSIKPLNEQYANLRAGASALERRIPIEERNNAVSLSDIGLAGAGGAVGGGPGAMSIFALKKLLTSQPARSFADQGLWNYGNAPNAIRPSPLRLFALPPSGSKSF
jgi:hypothetical protein